MAQAISTSYLIPWRNPVTLSKKSLWWLTFIIFQKNVLLYLDEGDGGGVHHDGHVEKHLDTEQGRGEHSDTRFKSEMEWTWHFTTDRTDDKFQKARKTTNKYLWSAHFMCVFIKIQGEVKLCLLNSPIYSFQIDRLKDKLLHRQITHDRWQMPVSHSEGTVIPS